MPKVPQDTYQEFREGVDRFVLRRERGDVAYPTHYFDYETFCARPLEERRAMISAIEDEECREFVKSWVSAVWKR